MYIFCSSIYWTMTAEAKYPINITKSNERFVLSLQYNGSFLFANATKIQQLNTKDSEIKKKYSLCLGNVSKDFTIDNMKKTGLKGRVKFCSKCV